MPPKIYFEDYLVEIYVILIRVIKYSRTLSVDTKIRVHFYNPGE